jgi:glycosyltransferase involved in cell wall biosynthesis
MNIALIGPAHPLRGGLASYNERLARELQNMGHSVIIYTFSLQYPGFLFPGTTQFSTEPAPSGLTIKVCINSINPFNWFKIGNELKEANPDLIIVRYWLPFMGPALGTILRRVKKNKHTKVVCIADNIIPHEKRPGDVLFTKYFIKPVDAFITMSEKVLTDLQQYTQSKPAQFVPHPLYDNFGNPIAKEEARSYLKIPQHEFIFLFFGFIRKYKGLDLLLQAVKHLNSNAPQQNFKVLIAGEFYEDRKFYDELIKQLGIEKNLILKTDFIPDSEVKYYLCAADAVVQPYRNATQSGVTPLAYHFEIPMIVTNVGGLPSLVPNQIVGLVCEPTPDSIATAMIEMQQKGKSFFVPGLQNEKKKYSWTTLSKAILSLAGSSVSQ